MHTVDSFIIRAQFPRRLSVWDSVETREWIYPSTRDQQIDQEICTQMCPELKKKGVSGWRLVICSVAECGSGVKLASLKLYSCTQLSDTHHTIFSCHHNG